MQVDYLIVGQGISGTLLSFFLEKAGKRFLVVDEERPGTASRVAAGIINPVTGRRYSTTWMIETLLPFAIDTYRELETVLGLPLVYQKNLVDFFPTPQMLHSFVERVQEGNPYMASYPDQNHFNRHFNYDFGCGEIRPAYTVNVSLLLEHWRRRLQARGALLSAPFNSGDVELRPEGLRWKDVRAEKLLLCHGASGLENPWFSLLPFAPNKGEALVIEAPGLNNQHVFKKGMLLAPLPQEGLFWAGSAYQWEYADAGPSEAFREKTEAQLKSWLRLPFRVMDHKAALRPATVERRPFVGLHPQQPQVGILNGMGSKGTSLAPFFASQLVRHLVHGLPLAPEADVRRFSRILSR